MIGYHIHVANRWAIFCCDDEGEADVNYYRFSRYAAEQCTIKVEVSVLTPMPDLLSLAILYSHIPLTLYHPPASVFISIIICCFIGLLQGVPWKKTLYNISHIPYMISSFRHFHGMVMVASRLFMKGWRVRGDSKTSKPGTDGQARHRLCLLDNIISSEVTNFGPCYV